MSELLRVSTDNIEPRHRLDFWSAMVANTFAPFEITESPGVNFHGRCTASHVGDILLAQTDFAPSAASRRRDMIRSAHFDGFMFAIPNKGSIEYVDDGLSSIAQSGDIAFYDYSRSFDFAIKCNKREERLKDTSPGIETINITIPRDVMTRLLGPAPKAAGLVIGAAQPSNLIIRNFFQALVARAHLLDATTATRMASIGLDLLAAGLAERLSYEPKQSTGAASLAYRAKTFIDSRLWDSQLTVSMVAGYLGISARRLQTVFAEQELTIDGFIWDQRLQKAHQQLSHSAFDGMSISEIGYSVGFSSLPHFTRRFTQAYAMTPTDCRQQARRAKVSGHM